MEKLSRKEYDLYHSESHITMGDLDIDIDLTTPKTILLDINGSCETLEDKQVIWNLITVMSNGEGASAYSTSNDTYQIDIRLTDIGVLITSVLKDDITDNTPNDVIFEDGDLYYSITL